MAKLEDSTCIYSLKRWNSSIKLRIGEDWSEGSEGDLKFQVEDDGWRTWRSYEMHGTVSGIRRRRDGNRTTL